MRLAWLTDLHLPASSHELLEALCDDLLEEGPDVVLVGGDTGNAPTFATLLGEMEARLSRPIYFVLGNHDFYGGSLEEVRRRAADLSAQSRWLHWLSAGGAVRLTDQTGLIGHDGWADGRLGKGMRSTLVLNDYVRIRDFIPLGQVPRFQKLAELGDEAAAHFRAHLPGAAATYPNLLLLTHVPPFAEATWHDGKISDDNWLPHFSCKAAGEALVDVMTRHPVCETTVLCGHTHGEGEARILENLRVLTGGAEYGKPKIQRVFEVP